MEEILDHLPPGARVLDLGAYHGSFPDGTYPLQTVRVDLLPPAPRPGAVQADASLLPFRARTFDAVILNHSLEHFARLKPSLQEVGRVVKQDGAVFVAVPDATTFADRLYRKLFRDRGGHVNLFGSHADLAKMLSWYFGLPHVATRTLLCSYPFLNCRNTAAPGMRRQTRFRGLPEGLLALLTGAFRLLDRRAGLRSSVYGWALYFGRIPQAVDPAPRTNVCVRCGQGHPSDWLARIGLVRRRWGLDCFSCPACGASNVYTRDGDFASLR